jgi:hypothetical protein
MDIEGSLHGVVVVTVTDEFGYLANPDAASRSDFQPPAVFLGSHHLAPSALHNQVMNYRTLQSVKQGH